MSFLRSHGLTAASPHLPHAVTGHYADALVRPAAGSEAALSETASRPVRRPRCRVQSAELTADMSGNAGRSLLTKPVARTRALSWASLHRPQEGSWYQYSITATTVQAAHNGGYSSVQTIEQGETRHLARDQEILKTVNAAFVSRYRLSRCRVRCKLSVQTKCIFPSLASSSSVKCNGRVQNPA